MAGWGRLDKSAKSPRRRCERTNFFQPSLFNNSTSRVIYVPKSGLTTGAIGGWSRCLLVAGRAGGGVGMVE